MSRRVIPRPKTREDGWEGWGGYMNAKRQKLNAQYQETVPTELKKENSIGSNIFAGVTIHVNGYTNPSSDELKRLMMLHGGKYEHYLSRTRVSHVIATNLPQSKVREIRGLKVVRPEWITESIVAGKLLPYSKYLLYTAQTSGLQKGLQSFSVNNAENTDTISNQFKQLNAELNSDQVDASETDIKNNRSTLTSATSNLQSLDSGVGSLDSVTSFGSTTSDHVDPGSKIVKRKSPETLSIAKERVASNTTSNHSHPSAGDPKFLNEFYSNSRLHYLSTWKAEFKSYVNELQNKGGKFDGKEELRKIVLQRLSAPEYSSHEGGYSSVRGKKSRCVMHIDMDCFFVSVGLRKRPDLKGRPVAVTHSKGRGASIDPESDLNFEVRERQKRMWRGHKVKSPVSLKQQENLSFPDISDSDSEDDITDDVISTKATSTESFHSMAEIASCSYEARKVGVKNGMFMGRAKTLCPDLVTIPYDFEGYNEVSRILYDTVASFTHDIEAVSCDELLVDCTDLLGDTGATPLEFATLLREKISNSTGCSASAGLGSNILLAKLATRKAKPNGQYHLTDDQINDHIRDQPVGNIPGVGRSMVGRFGMMNVLTCGDLQRHSLELLQREFGPKTGQSLYRYCRGQDDRPIKIEQQRKSVSAEVNYGIRFTTDAEAVKFLHQLSEEVCTRLRNILMKGKTITLKLMVRRPDAPKQTSKFMGHGICNNLCKSVTLPVATDEPRIIGKETVGLLKLMKTDPADLRGIGIQMQRLEPATLGPGGKPSNSILHFTVPKSAENSAVNTSSSACSSNSRNNSSKTNNINSSHCNITITGNRSSSVNHLTKKNNTSPSDTNNIINDDSNSNNSNGVNQLTRSNHTSPRDSNNINNNDYSSSNTSISGNSGRHNLDRTSTSTNLGVSMNIENLDLPNVTGAVQSGKPPSEHTEKHVGNRPVGTVPQPTSPVNTRTMQGGSRESSTPGPSIATQNEDYFPSPSQVDLEVLAELPTEIRQQIEAEMKQRQKKKQTPAKPVTNHSITDDTEAGPSHFVDSSTRQTAEKRQNREEIAESRRNMDVSKTDNILNPTEADGNSAEDLVENIMPASAADDIVTHVVDQIVALPSPSQIDPSCLEALPESLQAELRAAYAEQASRARELSDRGSNPQLQLRQASPTSSPSKRSPGKRSPHFKVPRGRPRGRGNSRKNLFRGRGAVSTRETRSSISSFMKTSSKPAADDPILISEDDVTNGTLASSKATAVDSIGDQVQNPSPGLTVDDGEDLQQFNSKPLNQTSGHKGSSSSSGPIRSADCDNNLKNMDTSTKNVPSNHGEYHNMEAGQSTSKLVEFPVSTSVTDTERYDNIGTTITAGKTYTTFVAPQSDEVNLCGAVTIRDVRELMREWLQSTVSPQDEDEMVLVNYLNDLILDKNLEQVDLVLKFLYRQVTHLQNEKWLQAVERIYGQTQALVYNMYGARLHLWTDTDTCV